MIPALDIHSVIPPIRPGVAGHSRDRAPYPTDIFACCEQFGDTGERRTILHGLLDLRDALRTAGIGDGYQWLDGSFFEDVERLESRPPRDVDVVTFAPLGDGNNQRRLLAASPALLDPVQSKINYHVDHYVLATDRQQSEADARRVAYWYSMWSHQRTTHRWKGFVSVSLKSNDAHARDLLHKRDRGTP